MHKNERLHFLLRKYLENSCTKEELTGLLALSQDNDLGQQLNGELKAYWNSLDAQKLREEVNWESNYRHIIEMGRSTESFDQSLKSRVVKLRFWKVAAVLLLILGTAFVIWNASLPVPKRELASGEAPVKPKDSRSHRQLINLPDGSRVILNANSKLEYPPDFSSNSREVYLNGEAFFDIAHDPSKPFIVHTGSVRTKVLGTAFNINAYRAQQFVEVTVTRGKVEVASKEKVLGVLQKNEQIIFHSATGNHRKQTVSTEPVVAWKRNELYFDDISFAEAALVLSNRYHVSIEFVNEKIRGCRFTAAFDSSTTLEHALAVICELNNATYRKDENRIVIDGNGCE